MLLKTKVLVVAVISLLGVTGVAFAATGHVPQKVSDGFAAVTGTTGTTTAAGDQYGDNDTSASHDQYGGDHDSASHDQYGDDDSATEDQYGENHGMEVREVAKDKDATESTEMPNGHEVENHGQAVRDTAAGSDGEGAAPTQGVTTVQGHDSHSGHMGQTGTTGMSRERDD